MTWQWVVLILGIVWAVVVVFVIAAFKASSDE